MPRNLSGSSLEVTLVGRVDKSDNFVLRKLSRKLFNVDQKKKIVQIKIRRKILLLMTQ